MSCSEVCVLLPSEIFDAALQRQVGFSTGFGLLETHLKM